MNEFMVVSDSNSGINTWMQRLDRILNYTGSTAIESCELQKTDLGGFAELNVKFIVIGREANITNTFIELQQTHSEFDDFMLHHCAPLMQYEIASQQNNNGTLTIEYRLKHTPLPQEQKHVTQRVT